MILSSLELQNKGKELSVFTDALQSIGNWYADLSATTSLLVLILAAIAVMWVIYWLLGPWDQPYIQKEPRPNRWRPSLHWEWFGALANARARAHGQHNKPK